MTIPTHGKTVITLSRSLGLALVPLISIPWIMMDLNGDVLSSAVKKFPNMNRCQTECYQSTTKHNQTEPVWRFVVYYGNGRSCHVWQCRWDKASPICTITSQGQYSQPYNIPLPPLSHTATKRLFGWNFRHWLHQKLPFWWFLEQSVMTILSK